jgi:glutathionylspermidine synthase
MLSRWTDFLSTDGEKEWRKRDDEFEVQQLTKNELIEIWEKGWSCCIDALQSLTEDDLLKLITIRKEPLTVVDAINRQLAHYPYHVGQIVFLGKLLLNYKWKSLSIDKKR